MYGLQIRSFRAAEQARRSSVRSSPRTLLWWHHIDRARRGAGSHEAARVAGGWHFQHVDSRGPRARRAQREERRWVVTSDGAVSSQLTVPMDAPCSSQTQIYRKLKRT